MAQISTSPKFDHEDNEDENFSQAGELIDTQRIYSQS
jgi:hypothetical protein